MNWEAIGALAELAGAIAVVVTLYYLASQIRQSNTLARRNEHNATMEQVSLFRMAVAQSEELATLLLTGAKSYSVLSEVHKVQFDNLIDQRFWNYAQIWDRVQTGSMEREMWNVLAPSMATNLNYEGIREWWDLKKFQFPSGFVTDIEPLNDGNQSK